MSESKQPKRNTKRDVATLLRRAARAQAKLQEFTFSKDSRGLLYYSIKIGVDKIAAEGKLQDSESINIAEVNVARFVDEMVKVAKGQGRTYLGESTFDGARASLCPIWPIC